MIGGFAGNADITFAQIFQTEPLADGTGIHSHRLFIETNWAVHEASRKI